MGESGPAGVASRPLNEKAKGKSSQGSRGQGWAKVCMECGPMEAGVHWSLCTSPLVHGCEVRISTSVGKKDPTVTYAHEIGTAVHAGVTMGMGFSTCTRARTSTHAHPCRRTALC